MSTLCIECGKRLDTCIEKVPHHHLHRYTVWCGCVAGEYQIDDSVMESSTESWESMHKYGIDRAYENWQEALFKKKNPGSETEAGVDEDAIWEAVLEAMKHCHWIGYRQGRGFKDLTPDFERILKERLGFVIDDPSA